jgi:hypothetical protein
MHLKAQLLSIDRSAIAEVSDPSILGLREDVHNAIRDFPEARELL